MDWDPQQYDKFRAAREQPFADVVALIRADGEACASSTSAAGPGT